MKKIFTFILMLFLALSCSTTKNVGDLTFGTSVMMNSYEMQITQHQLDSICVADILPTYDKWIKTSFIDYETDSVFTKRLYLKDYSDENEVIYILLGEKEPYKITKRIAEK